MKIVLFCLAISLFFASCQPDPTEESDSKDNKNHISIKFNSPKDPPQEILDIKNLFNQVSLFLAGRKTDEFKALQKKDYYVNYKDKLDEAWKNGTAKNLENIKKWKQLNRLPVNDTIPLFYPFSGPDIVYANAFFPKAKTQILIGLENPGKLPNLSKMDDHQISLYLYNLYHSLRYINQAGYFTTSQMINDFSDSSLNGIIHLLCFYISKTNNHIGKIGSVQIDHYGTEKEKKNFEVADEYINGIKIEYFSNEYQIYKTLYYFPIDLSNGNLKDQLGFLMFLNKFGEKNTFLKSASYLLHDNDFSIIRDLILQQSGKILQDDSGIPFEIISNSGFSVQLYGNYSQTIKIFSKYYQPDLKKALNEQKNKPLPFKLGYNSWKNEMVLMYAEKSIVSANPPITYMTEKEGIVFKVQFKSSWKKIPPDAEVFKGMPKVDYYFKDNLYKYTIGSFSTEAECADYIKIAVKQGFTDAFVVAFYQKNRISLEEANQIVKANSEQ
jgi:hypothetical protein